MTDLTSSGAESSSLPCTINCLQFHDRQLTQPAVLLAAPASIDWCWVPFWPASLHISHIRTSLDFKLCGASGCVTALLLQRIQSSWTPQSLVSAPSFLRRRVGTRPDRFPSGAVVPTFRGVFAQPLGSLFPCGAQRCKEFWLLWSISIRAPTRHASPPLVTEPRVDSTAFPSPLHSILFFRCTACIVCKSSRPPTSALATTAEDMLHLSLCCAGGFMFELAYV